MNLEAIAAFLAALHDWATARQIQRSLDACDAACLQNTERTGISYWLSNLEIKERLRAQERLGETRNALVTASAPLAANLLRAGRRDLAERVVQMSVAATNGNPAYIVRHRTALEGSLRTLQLDADGSPRTAPVRHPGGRRQKRETAVAKLAVELKRTNPTWDAKAVHGKVKEVHSGATLKEVRAAIRRERDRASRRAQ